MKHNEREKKEKEMDYKSHTKKDIIKAQKKGKKIWSLDTGNDGEDDMLIGEREDVIQDILYYHHDIESMPEHWELDLVDWEIEI